MPVPLSVWGLLAYGVFVAADLGATFGALWHYLSEGRRDFASAAQTKADHYEVQVDDGYANEAQRVLSTMPAS
jgi:hypothetical protein